MRVGRSGRIAGFVAAIVAVTPVAQGRTPDRLHLAVAEQPLGDALVDFAIQANVTISTPRGGFGALRSRELHGALTIEESLRRLLAHSGFAFEKVDAVTFRIVAVGAGPPRRAARQRPNTTNADEVVIRAGRQPHALDRFAASASVIGDDALQRLHATSATDLTESVSGIGFTNLGPGRNKIMIRGLSDGAFSGRTESTVGVYVEDSRITYGAPDPDLKLVDIERVEILRGPQGALYGGGSIGGIYRITPAPPDLEKPSGFLTASGEGVEDGGVGDAVEGMINLPIVRDRIGLRLVAYRENAPGWLDNPTLGVSNTNATVRDGLRATLAARLDNSWTVSGRLLFQGINSADSQYAQSSSGDEVRSSRVLEPHDNDFSLLSATVRGRTPWGAFDSTTTALHHAYDSVFDASPAFVRLGPPPRAIQTYAEASDLKFFVEEARLTGVASPFPWTLGAFYSLGRLEADTRLRRIRLNGRHQDLYAGERRDNIREYAIYGEATWPLTRQLDFSVGLRAFRTELETRVAASGVAPALSDQFADSQSHTGLAPQFRLSYEPEVGAFYYLQASNGYRSGGFNAGSSAALDHSATGAQPFRRYGPDELWSYEAGIKHTFLDQRLRIRAAGFLQVWENIQTDQLVAADLPFTGNVGDGEIRGGEFESQFRWSDRLTLSAHVTYADAEVVDARASFPTGADTALPGSPRVSGGGAVDFERPFSGESVLRLHLGATYIGSSRVTFPRQESVNIGGYFTANANAAYETGSWRGVIYVENIANGDAGTFSYGNLFQLGAADLSTPQRPRTVGVEITRRF